MPVGIVTVGRGSVLLGIVLRHRGVSDARVSSPSSAGYSTQPVTQIDPTFLTAARKITHFAGAESAVVNRRYYVRWPG